MPVNPRVQSLHSFLVVNVRRIKFYSGNNLAQEITVRLVCAANADVVLFQAQKGISKLLERFLVFVIRQLQCKTLLAYFICNLLLKTFLMLLF